MYRAILELLITIVVIAMARALLSSVLKGVSSAARNATSNPDSNMSGRSANQAAPNVTGTLHKDPVCGTYVAETTAFQRRIGSGLFFYCSEACKAAHQIPSK